MHEWRSQDAQRASLCSEQSFLSRESASFVSEKFYLTTLLLNLNRQPFDHVGESEGLAGVGRCIVDVRLRLGGLVLSPAADGAEPLAERLGDAAQAGAMLGGGFDVVVDAEAVAHQRSPDPASGECFTWVPRNPEAEDLPNSRLSHPYYWAPFILIGNGL
ncbi:MAG: hypothetical protein ACFB5Z_15270 [Elainellaceae cyanobacterium]